MGTYAQLCESSPPQSIKPSMSWQLIINTPGAYMRGLCAVYRMWPSCIRWTVST